MATTTTVTLIPTTTHGTAVGNYNGSSASFSSDKVKGDGYYGFSDGMHTVAWRVSDFVGTVKIQGSLAQDPASTDWVDINLREADGSYSATADGLISEVTTLSQQYTTATSESRVYNLKGNFVWIRANISSFTAGTINTVQLAN
jgi:hypothetical protein